MTLPFIRLTFYQRLLADLFRFVKTPSSLEEQPERTVKIKLYDTLGLFIIKMLFSVLLAITISQFYDPENRSTTGMMERFTPIVFLMVGGIILPLLEEITFRLSLRFKPIYLALTLGGFTYYILTKIVYQTKNSMVDESFTARIVGAFLAILLSFFVISIPKINRQLHLFWKNHIRALYYISCLLFAWVHIFNYEPTFTNFLLFPILTLPQLFSAIIAGYTRVSFGFQYPLILHISTNLLFISMMFLPFD